MTHPREKQSAAQRTFAQYTQYITEAFLEKYGYSYENQSNVRNTWRAKHPYSKEAEDLLIFKSKMFIRFLDARNSNSTNPQFLKALTGLMADYLSAYSMKNPDVPNRKKAKEMLNRALYDQSVYIQDLLARQAVSRINKKTSTTKRISSTQSKKAAAAKNRHDNIQRIRIQVVETVLIKKR